MVGKLGRVGLLGGTFDPPHLGHLALAKAALNTLQLDEIWFIPAGQPVHKHHTITPGPHRLAMTKLLVASQPKFRVITNDLDRPPPHYTATLIPTLQGDHPDTEFWLIIGEDSLRDLDSWHQPDLILKQLKLAVLSRPGVLTDWIALCQRFPTLPERMRWLEGTRHDAASSSIRAQHSFEEHLQAEISAYIERNGLYTSQAVT